jgi:phosphatidylserine synthase
MSVLVTHAAWVLVITFTISFCYELYRATIMAGTSRHDSLRGLAQTLVLYVVAATVIAALFAGLSWAVWAGLVFSVLMILVSIFYYNPKVLLERKPGIIDWLEDLVYTGLLFVAATLLVYEIVGKTLRP